MSISTQRRLLWLLAAGLFSASGLIVSAGFMPPLEPLESSSTDMPDLKAPDTSDPPATPSASAKRPLLDSFLVLAARDYRQLLFDPPPPIVQEQPPPPLPKFRLVGTLLNPNRPLAMITEAGGRIVLKTVGDRIGQDDNVAVIESIEIEQIRLRHQGRTVIVKKE